jgi:hypothetical protein
MQAAPGDEVGDGFYMERSETSLPDAELLDEDLLAA